MIGKLPPIVAGGACAKDPLHVSAGLSDLNLKRIRISKEGGTWNDWPKELRAKCHQKESGKTYGGVALQIILMEPGRTSKCEML